MILTTYPYLPQTQTKPDYLKVIKMRGASPQLNSSANSAVTQPVGDPRNIRRNQQIKALHLQFQDLKKKIKDVQSKNQKIIENIHKQYDFKKKPQTAEYLVQPTHVVHYQQRNEKSNLMVENRSSSDHSDGDYKRPVVKKVSSVKKAGGPAFHQSIEYRKTQNGIDQRDPSDVGSSKTSNPHFRPPLPSTNQFAYSAGSQFTIPPMQTQEQFQISQFNGLPPYQVSMQFPPYSAQNMAMSQVGSFYSQGNNQFQQALKRQRQKIKLLEKEIEDRDMDLAAFKKLQKKYGTLANNYNETVELCLEEFFDEVIKKRLYEIDKYVKKNENKLKKIQLRLKDREEDERSRKIISEHQSKRSNSRSKRQSSPRQNYNSLTNMPKMPSKRVNQSLSIPNDTKSKQSEQSKSSQQFEEIATQYQEMIKTKTKEVQAYEIRLKQKEKELMEMTAKCTKLQARLADNALTPPTMKNRRSSEENLLNSEEGKDYRLTALNRKLSQLEDLLNIKQKELMLRDSNLEKSNKKIIECQGKIKKNQAELTKLKEQYRLLQKEKKQDSGSANTKKLESQLQLKDKQIAIQKDKSVKLQNQKIQKECQNLTLSNKLKKMQSLLSVKEEKITELEKIIQSSVGGEPGDLLEKSMYLEKIDHNDLHNLQEQKERLEEELIKQREQIFFLAKNNENLSAQCSQYESNCQQLKKEIQTLMIHNQSMRITLKAQEFEKYKVDSSSNPLQKLLEEGDCLSQNEDDHLIRDQLEELKAKYEETQSLLKIQNQKTFEENRKVLKLTSQLNYFKEQLADRQDKYQKLRKEYEQGKCQYSQLQQSLQQKQGELQVQRKVNAEKIKEIETQWLQFEQQVRNNEKDRLDTSRDQDTSQLRNSRHFSQQSFVNYKNTYNNVNAENERLAEKLKQLEKVIEVQKEMEDKIVNEYRTNVQKIKAELRDKGKEGERLAEENEGLKRRVRILEQSESRLKELAKGQEEENLLGSSTHRVIELEMEVNEMREINIRLQAVQQQLFNQISEKERDIQEMIKGLNARDKRIEELQDIIELKQMNFSSHISTSQHRSKVRESMQSQSSLRYSMMSNNRDKTMELDLSQAGESFFDHNQSMISNVSEVFGREEFPYEKLQLRRVEQRRLFEKTAAYIKSLKHAIDEKNKKIKILERKVESLRNSQLIRKDIYEVKESNDIDLQGDFKDYYSVQLESSNSQRYKFKQLEHQTKLTIQENNLLNNQIQSMQEELLKAEEQENSLMKLKDLYKDQIKNLIKQNQDQMKIFQEEVKKERTKVEQSESVQKMEALKQIFVKIISVFQAIQTQGPKSRKKQEKKKELDDYLKVCCNLMSFQPQIRDQLLGKR